MADRNVHILGSVWVIKEQSIGENKLLENCDGYCDWTTREIVVEREQDGTLGDMETYIRKVIRHEIIHAFLFECGLYEASAPAEAWAKNEEMVDWFARQGEKIYAAWKQAGALGKETGVTAQEWLSVKDRLPEKDQIVLCYKAGRGVRIGKHLVATFADGVSAFKDCLLDYAFGATHWMPLPQPPKGE